jgi:hypothetical protein
MITIQYPVYDAKYPTQAGKPPNAVDCNPSKSAAISDLPVFFPKDKTVYFLR